MFQDAAVAQSNFVADDCEGADFYALAELRGGRNDRPRINFAHRAHSSEFTHRAYSSSFFTGTRAPKFVESLGMPSGPTSTMAHIRVASAASSPFTRAWPCTLQNG